MERVIPYDFMRFNGVEFFCKTCHPSLSPPRVSPPLRKSFSNAKGRGGGETNPFLAGCYLSLRRSVSPGQAFPKHQCHERAKGSTRRAEPISCSEPLQLLFLASASGDHAPLDVPRER